MCDRLIGIDSSKRAVVRISWIQARPWWGSRVSFKQESASCKGSSSHRRRPDPANRCKQKRRVLYTPL